MDRDVVFVLEGSGGDDVVKIEVCHQVMANASPVFRVMLDGSKFKEGDLLRSTGRCEVNLAETHAGAFQVLCQIFHLQGDLVSGKVDISLLYEIASLVDRYDCLTAIQPWPKIWRQENDEHFSGYSSPISSAELSSVLRMVHISSVFGFEDISTYSCTFFLRNVQAANFAEPLIEHVYNNLSPNVQGVFSI